MASSPPDYFSAMGGAANMVDPSAAISRGLMQQLQPEIAQQQLQAQAQQLQMQRIALQRQLTFGGDMQAFLAHPSAEGFSGLIGKYPEFGTQLKDAYGVLDSQRQRSDATQIGSAASLAAKGDYQGAAAIAKARIDADRAAGHDTSASQAIYDHLTSDDPAQQKAALGMLTVALGAAVGPEHASDFLKANGFDRAPVNMEPGHQLVDPTTGHVIASVAPNLTAVSRTNNDGSTTVTGFNPQTGAFGAAALPGGASPAAAPGGASEAAAGAPGGEDGFGAAVQHVLNNEGGYAAHDMNGAPVNMGINQSANPGVDVKNLTREQAVQIYHDKYWTKSGAANLPANAQAPYFDAYVRNPAIAKQAWAQSGGDPVKFVQLATAKFAAIAARRAGGKYVNAYAKRDAGNLAIASGQATPAPGNATNASSGAPGAPAGQSDPYTFGGGGGPAPVNTKGAPQGYGWNADHTAVVPLKGSDQDVSSYPPAMLHDAAVELLTTGQMPSFGMGGGGIKKAILDERSRIMQQAGITADQLPTFRARYGADKAALQNISGIETGLKASEAALKPYMDQVLAAQARLASPGPKNPNGLDILDDGAPGANQARLELYSRVGHGSTKAAIKQYRDAINALTTEYSKFMSSASGMSNAPATDSSRNLAGELTDETLGPAAMAAHMQQLQREASIKMNSVTKARQDLEQKLSGYLGGTAAPSSAPQQIGTYQGHPVFLINGRRVIKQ